MELLEKHFDTAFSASNGIEKLRELVLTLGMKGKLVSQNSNDGSAISLFRSIAVEKQLWIDEQKIKKVKPSLDISDKDVPYQLPDSWKWVRLNDVAMKIHYGYTASANHDLNNVRLLRITDIQNNKVDWESVPGCDAKAKDVEQYLLNNDDILIARTGGTVGKSYLVQNISVKAVFASYLIRVVPSSHIDVNYLKLFIESPLYWSQLYEKCSGTGQPNVNGTALSALLLTLPPLAEQRRIVAKIDQLMARCDELEKLREARDRTRIKVHMAACDRLLTAKDPDTFAQSWQFITQHFNELYLVKENVIELRKAILQLAVMGKLVLHNPDDLPAQDFLSKIEIEKQQLIKEDKIKKSNPLHRIKTEDVPYLLPEAWEWAYLQDLLAVVTDGDHQAPPKADSGVPFLVIGNLNTGRIRMNGCRFVPKSYYESLVWMRKPSKNDVLYTVTGSYGIPVTVDSSDEFCVQRHVAILKSVESSPIKYLSYFLKSEYAFRYATSIATGIAQKTVPLTGLRKMKIAVPPLAEQHRIVAKVDQLMTLCDTLEQQIDATTQKQTALLNAVTSKI